MEEGASCLLRCTMLRLWQMAMAFQWSGRLAVQANLSGSQKLAPGPQRGYEVGGQMNRTEQDRGMLRVLFVCSVGIKSIAKCL